MKICKGWLQVLLSSAPRGFRRSLARSRETRLTRPNRLGVLSSDFTYTDHVRLKNLQNFVLLLRCSVRWCQVLFQISNADRESQMKPPIALLSKNALS